jgi:serine/threonine-protein kinase
MGVVYRAHDTRLDRDVALKVIRSGAINDRSARERFKKEALLLSKLCHPNIAQVYDFDEQEGVEFLIMEYVNGNTFASTIKGGPIPKKPQSMWESKSQGPWKRCGGRNSHRDLKPNTMITKK